MLRSSEIGVARPNIREAIRGLSVLVRDPNNTVEGFRVLEALDPRIHHRELACMSSEPSGEKLLREQPVLLDVLRDRTALEALPEGSLGREYRKFCVREGLEPDAFVEVGEAGSQAIADPLVRYAAHRFRDSHDVWHVVCGYRTDLAGEAAILAFYSAQTQSPGMYLLLLGAMLHSVVVGRSAGKTMRRLASVGWRRGLRARPLAAAPWEKWLARPIADVRAELGIADVPEYEPAYGPPREPSASSLRTTSGSAVD
jgi:ubiquinone biosynthesis protein COQ4